MWERGHVRGRADATARPTLDLPRLPALRGVRIATATTMPDGQHRRGCQRHAEEPAVDRVGRSTCSVLV
jgi:hypothetical protein